MDVASRNVTGPVMDGAEWAMLLALAALWSGSSFFDGIAVLDPPSLTEIPAEHVSLPNSGYPERSVEMCLLTGNTTKHGLHYTLARWWPGCMSAPHTYVTDRFCAVVSGTWWCNSGADFDLAAWVPVVAGTPHHDGVIRGHDEPAVIAICGMGPVGYALCDPTRPGGRAA